MTRALRVGLVAHAGLGGSGTVATDLAMGLSERGHEVHMITPGHPFRLADGSKVHVHTLDVADHPMWDSPPWTLALASRVAEVAKSAELDVLHAHFAIPYFTATELACQIVGPSAPPWIATVHGSDVDALGRHPVYAPVVRHALGCASRVSAPSAHLRAAAQRDLTPELDIRVIPNFVDGERFCPAVDRPPPSQHGAVFVHASSFRQVKRVGDVVAIFARIAEVTPSRLLLLGDGPERPAALARLAELGLGDRVEAPGAKKDVETYLARAHVALLPSERESFGLAALEALASAVPVIATDVGGLPEVVRSGEMGFLAPVGAIRAMADAALDIINDDDRWAVMARAARKHALRHFTPDVAFAAYERLYDEALQGHRPRAAR